MAGMTLKTYRAPTMAEALTSVKKELGKDAVILHTRTYKVGTFLGFFGKQMVEITASVGVGIASAREVRQSARQAASLSSGHEPPAKPAAAIRSAALERAYGLPPGVHIAVKAPPATSPTALSAASATPARAAVSSANSAAASAAFTPDLRDELNALKQMMGQVLQSTIRDGAPAVAMPPGLLKLYLKLIQNDVSRELADEIASDVRDELSPGELADEGIVRQAVLRRLESLIPADASIATPARDQDGRPLTVALIGPTGVGKTTTLAKLAAAYRLRHGKRVALITADTYRIAAVDQLRTYANIIGVPLKVAGTPEEMDAACQEFADFDVVLIDTAGRSPSDHQRLNELGELLDAARPHQVHLVLAAVASESVMVRTAERFSAMRPTRMIFTKLDEAASFGVLVNVAQRVGAKLSYVTAGQEVPDDIEPGRSDRLARLILDGRPDQHTAIAQLARSAAR